MTNYSKTQKIITLILKAIVVISAIIGVISSAFAGSHTFMGGKVVFMYFTIQSNIIIALICGIGCYFILKDKVSNIWNIIKYVGTVSITLTGIVFCFVLAPTMGAAAWNLQNLLTHVIVPVIAVVDFFVSGISGDIKKKNVIFVIIPPLLYAIYAGIGFSLNWQFGPGVNYPYFFLNWGSPLKAFGFGKELPFMGCMWWILLLLLFLIGVGFLYLAIVNALKKKFSK